MGTSGGGDGAEQVLTEAQVVDAVARYLATDGWEEVVRASTTGHGIDLLMRKGSAELAVEAKGEGSSQRHTARFGKPFTTEQVRQHVAVAVATALKVMSQAERHAAVAFPDNAAHRYEVEALMPALRRCDVTVFWVTLDGEVTAVSATPSTVAGSSEMIEHGDGAVEIVEYDVRGDVVTRTHGSVGPTVENDVAVINATLLLASDDWPKLGSWDLWHPSGAKVTRLAQLIDVLGWQDPIEDELCEFMRLPAFVPAPAGLRRDIWRRLIGTAPTGRKSPSRLELVVATFRDDDQRLADALLRFIWEESPGWPEYGADDWLDRVEAAIHVDNTRRKLQAKADDWRVPEHVLERLRKAWRRMGWWPDRPWVPVETWSNYDGDLHLVARTPDVDGWQVTLFTPGRSYVEAPEPFSGGHYPWLHGLPSWFIDPVDRFEIRVHGHLVRASTHEELERFLEHRGGTTP